ncbi:unnamed protein product [Trichobilharzia regenti]|nr:unnamed protein product [Trichobilharzia regenti]
MNVVIVNNKHLMKEGISEDQISGKASGIIAASEGQLQANFLTARKLQMKSSLSQDEEDILENSKLSNKLLSLNSDDDRKLAQSAQMYHYQHQKQQMLALEKLVT